MSDKPKREVKKKVKTNKPRRVIVDRDTEVIIMNNTNGNLFYKCPQTHMVYDMQSYGDIEYITVGELLIMNNRSRKMLGNLWLLIIDVVTEGVELEDVLKYLRLDKLYTDEVEPEKVDDFILKSGDRNFANTLEKVDMILAKKIVERSVILYREGKLNSIFKAETLKKFVGNDELFD